MVDDRVHFELSATPDVFRPLSAALVHLGDLAHAMDYKRRIATAGIKQTPEQLKIVQQHQNKFRKLCLKHYDACIACGLTPNKAVSETNKAIKEMAQFNTSYDIVRTVCRQARRMRP
jgi:hypothetical protein